MNDPANYDPGPGNISLESGSVMAMSDFVSDINPGARGPLLPSGVNLNMQNFADTDNVSQVPDCMSFGEPGSWMISPESGFAGGVGPESGGPILPSGLLGHGRLR